MKLPISFSIGVYCSLLVNASEWSKLADLPTSTPSNLTGRGVGWMTGGVVGDNLYLIGGQEGSRRGDVFDTKATRIFSTTANTWTAGKDAPELRERAASVVVNDTLYLIGGAQAGEELISYSNTWSYTPISDAWKELSPLPNTYYDAAACSVNETIYLFGGFPTNSDIPLPYNTTLIYSIKSNTWSEGKPLPQPVGGAACVTVGTDVYLFGGRYLTTGQYLYYNEIQIYDTVENTWSKGKPIPDSIKVFSATLIQDKVFIITSESTQPEVYDLTHNQWNNTYPKFPGSPRVSPSVLSHQNQVYIIGGQVDLYTDTEYIYLYSNETLSLEV
ncbi:NudC domain-containing protein 3 [Basidiobolus ranarum]|uniref:NudC domain-containing protein 3 n=1 Tax=Basidiobolus ranarum TaxID=34480 RepID=A0ABR2WW27_9FUNG